MRQSIARAGGRHLRGAKPLGELQVWKCVSCGNMNSTPFEQGCAHCPAGRPGVQQAKREPAPAVAPSRPPVRAGTQTHPGGAGGLAAQLRARGGGVDYDEIERRVARALDAHMGGGFSQLDRATLYFALECYITLWDQGEIEPTGGLTLEATRQLAARVAPEDLPADPELELDPEPEVSEESNAETSTESTSGGDPGREYPVESGSYTVHEHRIIPEDEQPGGAKYVAQPARPRPRPRVPAGIRRAPDAPELVDPGPGGDEVG